MYEIGACQAGGPLRRAVGKDAPPTGRQVQQQSAPTRPSVRGFLGLGDGESETSRLMQGQDNSSQGDLDSIFAKMDGSQLQVKHHFSHVGLVHSQRMMKDGEAP